MENTTAKGWRWKRRRIVENLYPNYPGLSDTEEYHFPRFDFREHDQLDLSELPYSEQERYFYDDLVAVFWGYNTRNIACYKEDESLHWWINDLADPCLISTVSNCLPLAEVLMELKILMKKIKSDRLRGTIAHYVCATCNAELKNRFYPFLEGKSKKATDKLVSKFLHDLQEFDGLFKMMLEVVRDIDKQGLIGGEIITYLEKASQKHALNPENIFAQMIQVTLARYFKILFEWLTHCSVDCDILHEFMIWDLRKTKLYKYSDFIRNSDGQKFEGVDPDFDERFVVIEELCPSVLKSVLPKIVRAGKYLFVAEKNSKSLVRPKISIDENAYQGRVAGDIRYMVEETCRETGALLWKRLLEDFDLESFFRALNTFFLGNTINWLTHFIQISDDYLDKEVEKIVPRTLNAFLMNAMEKTLQTSNRFSRNFKCVLLPSKLYTEYGTRTNPLNEEEDVYGPSQFCLTLEVNSNLRMLLPNNAIEKYMKIFRICYKLQRALYLLNQKNLFDPFLVARDRKEKIMIFNMTLVLNKVYGFWFVHTIPPLWEEFFTLRFKELNNVEDLIDAQSKMLNDIFEQCGFDQNMSDFINRVIEMVDIIVSYAKNRISFEDAYPAFENLFKELQFQAAQDPRFTELAFHVFRNGASEEGDLNDSVVYRV